MKNSLKGYLFILFVSFGAFALFVGFTACGGKPETTTQDQGRNATESVVSEGAFAANQQPRYRLVLPTENNQIFGDPTKFYMYTNRTFEGVSSKPWQGGQYGFVRNQRRTQIGMVYTRLHEGMDIKPVRRNSNGEPLDEVRSISDGKVVYVNNSASASSYGKYVVVMHEWPEGAFYSLYAHLSYATTSLGQVVSAGDKIGILGYTGAGINKERAHLHVELNFLLTNRFATWYGKHFTSKNNHGIYNGFNLTGMDIARFFKEHRTNPNLTVRDFLSREEPYFKVLAPAKQMPGILKRYPWLGRNMTDAGSAKSWEFTFARSGVPLAISPNTKVLKYPAVTWVKPVNTNHSYLTVGRLSGSGSNASLSGSGSRYIQQISEAF